MAEQTFKSPGFFEREIDLSQRESEIVGVPAGVVGTAQLGPAFVPVTVGSKADFDRIFGSLDTKQFGPYAVHEFLNYRTALTYVRVLGAGTNNTAADITNTQLSGFTKGAGFKISPVGSTTIKGQQFGAVQFIAAKHWVSASKECVGYPVLSDNDSFNVSAGGRVNLIRGMILTSTGSTVQIMDYTSSYSDFTTANYHNLQAGNTDSTGLFKLIISSSAGSAFATTDKRDGIRIYTASLDPANDAYIANILNTDPGRFQEEQHLLYGDFAVEAEVASVCNPKERVVAIVSGSASSRSDSPTSVAFTKRFGRFDARYSPAKTTWFISQPFGEVEHNLFKFETISDGSVVNEMFKVSISNIRKSSDPRNPYGTFTVEVRSFSDTDTSPQILEQYGQCTLDPTSPDYIGRRIGDYKAAFNFDAELESERKMTISGKYPNISSRVRVLLSEPLESGDIPPAALPFGFRGLPVLKTSDTLTDRSTSALLSEHSAVPLGGPASIRLTFNGGLKTSLPGPGSDGHHGRILAMTGSIVPPVPLTFKVTRGNAKASQAYIGQPGENERVDARFYWGVKFTSVAPESELSNSILNPNASSTINPLIKSYAKLLGIQKLDTLVTGSGADRFSNNKFTLSRVALSNRIQNNALGQASLDTTANGAITGSAKEHILESAYIRNGTPNTTNYTIQDGARAQRITLGSLAALTSSVYFNRFAEYTKFTNMFYGGFDGVNITDPDMAALNDRATSSDTGGKAGQGIPSATGLDIGLSNDNNFGAGSTNNIVLSYRAGAKILTDPMVSRVNIIAVPGIRDSSLTDYIFDLLDDYGKAIFLADIPHYDSDGTRIFSWVRRPSVTKTSEQFDSRAVDNNYSATYFPDVSVQDILNNQPVKVPSSVAAIGALAFNDKEKFPWFAPAGFNRGALSSITNVDARLTQKDRDDLYELRINPIATFPQAGYVIFGQKTLQMAKSSLDRINVRRMLLEVKRIVVDIANKLVFEQNTPETRARFTDLVTPKLSLIQSQEGIDQFRVVCDSTNNTQEDVENNVLNGRIVVVPTRAVEFVSIDFIITNAGVSFE